MTIQKICYLDVDGVQKERDEAPEEVAEREARAAATASAAAGQLIAALEADVQIYMDETAKARGYDNLISAITYRDDPTVAKWQKEGQAFYAWRSQVWLKCLDVKNQALAGTIPVPTEAELIAMLPPLTGLPD